MHSWLLLKSYRPEMKLEKMSIDLSWLGNSRIPKFVPFEWQLKAAKCCRPMAAGFDAASQYWVHGDGGHDQIDPQLRNSVSSSQQGERVDPSHHATAAFSAEFTSPQNATVDSSRPVLNAQESGNPLLSSDDPKDYSLLDLSELKVELKERKLKYGDKSKKKLQERLVADDLKKKGQSRTTNVPLHVPDTGPSLRSETPELLPDTSLGSDMLETSFEAAAHGLSDPTQSDDDSDGDEGNDSDSYEPLASEDSLKKLKETYGTQMEWVDEFIMNSRRKGGQNTERSVLKLWSTWVLDAIDQGLVPDLIIDANHLIQYLRRDDFDVTKGTILEYEVHLSQLDEIIASIFNMNQVQSVTLGTRPRALLLECLTVMTEALAYHSIITPLFAADGRKSEVEAGVLMECFGHDRKALQKKKLYGL
ncbi:hypothetical protein C8J56DRAFT_1091789 [Mycena floridula]|nr:hypothetical protein C8J56DRAFT_1091789 [Mycena floridula]